MKRQLPKYIGTGLVVTGILLLVLSTAFQICTNFIRILSVLLAASGIATYIYLEKRL